MSDQAQRLREHVEQTGRADGTYRDARGNIIRDIAPSRPETFEDYQNRLAWYRVSELMHNKKGRGIMSKEQDIEMLAKKLETMTYTHGDENHGVRRSFVGTHSVREIATKLVNTGVGFVGDRVATAGISSKDLPPEAARVVSDNWHELTGGHPVAPEELTRADLWGFAGPARMDEKLWSLILSDRVATEARVREQEAAKYRNTIAELKKRLENVVEIPTRWPNWARGISLIYTTCGAFQTKDKAGKSEWEVGPDERIEPVEGASWFPRPTPVKLTPEQMAEAIVGYHLKTSPELGETKDHDTVLADGWARLARNLLSGKSIETLYAEIGQGGTK